MGKGEEQHPAASPNSMAKSPPNLASSCGSDRRKPHQYPNPPDPSNPDPATLREQWRFAIRQYSKWYSHAWGTAIFAGLSFFALGWIIKGSNPLPSLSSSSSGKNHRHDEQQESDRSSPPAKSMLAIGFSFMTNGATV